MNGDFEVIRDPLWNNVRLDDGALRLLDSEPFQRLRYVRQLGHAYLVYPGATHSRFEHALGTYHLTRRVMTLLGERGEAGHVAEDEKKLVPMAALLHDIGHYPFSHALEEAGLPAHEGLAEMWLEHGELAAILGDTGVPDAAPELLALIRGESRYALAGLISGSLDLDKIDYLTRDARMCGVPYGTVDVDRLIHSITVVDLDGRQTVGIHEKGVSALESLLFAKFQMYRNVYWHHAVRSATVMFKRLVRDSIASGLLDVDWIRTSTDESLMETLRREELDLSKRLRARRLYKRVIDLPAAALKVGFGDWIGEEPDLCGEAEDALAARYGLRPGELLLDLPSKPAMLAANLPVLKRDGSVSHLGSPETETLMGLHGVTDQLHTNARRFRVFAARRDGIKADALIAFLETFARDRVG